MPKFRFPTVASRGVPIDRTRNFIGRIHDFDVAGFEIADYTEE